MKQLKNKAQAIENCKKQTRKTNYKEAGITLLALVVTIIVLLILAGIAISLALGNNGILTRAQSAHSTQTEAQIQEQINLAYYSALVDGQGNVTEDALNAELTKEFGTSGYTLDTGNASSWKVTVNEVEVDLPAGKGSNQTQTADPATEYGYANNTGVVAASTLVPGDLINYYYKDKNGQTQTIPCVVMYGANSDQGLQVISVDTVRDVVLGCSSDGTIVDPKAVEAFASGAPTGYENTNNDKGRWSYNHAIATLNTYAQDYMGDMAISARCVGAPVGSIVTSENESTNMLTGVTDNYFTNPTDYNGKFKNSDDNIYGTDNSASGSETNISKDLKTMDTLGVVRTPNSSHYWLASRFVEYYYNGLNFDLKRSLERYQRERSTAGPCGLLVVGVLVLLIALRVDSARFLL